MSEQKPKLRLGEMMVQRGLVTHDQLQIALKEQKKSGILLGRQMVLLGFVTEATVRDLVAQSAGQETIDLSNFVADMEALAMVPEAFARRSHLLPVSFDEPDQTLTVAMHDMSNVVVLDQLHAMFDGKVQVKVLMAAEAELERRIDQHYGYELSVDGILREIETGEADQSLQNEGEEYSQPVVRLVDALLVDAVKRGASDIHFEPEQVFLRIRYRIDGVLHQIRSLHNSYWPAIAVRLKVLSRMNIAETRTPQDGRINIMLCGRPIDFRVATHPTIHGENIVLRVLDREKSIVALDQLGLREEVLDMLKLMMARPEGVIIVTGPTGSGKTTTLYSLLSHLNHEGVNIMTLEYPVTLMRQTSVNEAAKVDFNTGIRSIMRQDPDIILVGEIRDSDTAEMAFRAAMTGHQVYTTLHTNSVFAAIPRLLDIGISPDVLAGSIIGVVAQRLVRALCAHCKESYDPSEDERKILGFGPDDNVQIYRPAGCNYCHHTGYRGRMAILEILRIDDDIDALIARRVPMDEIRTMADRKGFSALAQDGIRRIKEGYTSLSELARVADLTGRIM